MAADISFNDLIPQKQAGAKDSSGDISFGDLIPKKADTGGILSDYGKATAKAFMSGYRGLTEAPAPPIKGEGFWSGIADEPLRGAKRFASFAAAPIEMATSPLTGAIHSFGGRGLAGLESYAGEAAVAGLKRLGLAHDIPTPDRQQIYEQAQADIDKALMAAGPPRTAAGVMSAPLGGIGPAVGTDIEAAQQAQAASEAAQNAARAVKQAAKTPAPSPVEQAQERRQQAGTPVDIPRALTYTNPALRAGSVALSKAPWVGTPLDEAVRAVPAQMGAGVEATAGQFGPAASADVVGGGIEQAVGQAAEREAAQAQAAVEQQRQAQEQLITAHRNQAEVAAQQQFGNVHPNQMGENTGRAVQEAHDLQEAGTQVEWGKLKNIKADAEKRTFDNLHDTIENGLSDEGVTLDPVKTPNAWGMMQDMRRLSGQAPAGEAAGIPPRLMQALETTYGKGQVPAQVLEDLVPGSTSGMTPGKDPQFRLMGRHAPEPGSPTVSVQGLDALRRRVGQMAYGARLEEDRRASNAIKNQFGEFLNDTLENHLTPGSDPGARAAIQNAVDSTRAFKERFGYNTKNLQGENRIAARDLNLMATGNLGPEAVAQRLVGYGKPGTRPGASPLHDAIMNAVDNPAAVRSDMRGAYWNKLTEGQTPDAIARNVKELAQTRMGKTLFEPHEHTTMGQYAEIRQQVPKALKAAGAQAKQKPVPGEAEQLASKLLGRNRSPEKIFDAFDQAMRGGDIRTIERAWSRMPQDTRRQVQGAWLRGLGGGGEQFSVDKFITNWNAYSDRAKSIMLPDKGHRQAIEDFHTIAKEYSENLKRYGNPSGTAQVSRWHDLMVGTAKTAASVVVGATTLFHPVGMVLAGLGGRRLATLLARPQGARQLTRWSRMAKAYNQAPSTTKLITLQNATRSLASEAGKD